MRVETQNPKPSEEAWGGSGSRTSGGYLPCGVESSRFHSRLAMKNPLKNILEHVNHPIGEYRIPRAYPDVLQVYSLEFRAYKCLGVRP